MDGFQEGDPCPGKNKENRKVSNKLPGTTPSSETWRIDGSLKRLILLKLK
jgi:hypothetical protein